MFGKILFPVDFSPRCRLAASYMAGIAEKFNSKVTLLHAIGAYDGFSGADMDGYAYVQWQDWMRKKCETDIADFGRPCLDRFVTDRVVEDGEAGDVITGYAADNKFDLIMMPTHGHGMFRELLLGSVTSKVLHDTECPVWTLAHVEDAAAIMHPSNAVRKIVCAVEAGPEDEHIVVCAKQLSALYQAEVFLAHALPAPFANAEAYTFDTSLDRMLRDQADDALAAVQNRMGTSWETWLRPGGVAPVIREAATECGADLVLIGRGRIHERLGRLRSNSAAIIREAPCPVLSL